LYVPNPVVRLPREIHSRARTLAAQRRISLWDAVVVVLERNAKNAALLESQNSSIQQKPKDAQSTKISRVLPIPQETT
jgi:predicted nucleic acid-binding protein